MRGSGVRTWFAFGALLAVALGPMACEEERASSSDDESWESEEGARPTSSPASAPLFSPPHQGRLLSIPDGKGYVEWLFSPATRRAKIHFLDSEGKPLDVADTMLLVVTPFGPREVVLADCGDPGYLKACGEAELPWPQDAPPTGLIRLRIGNVGYRVLMPTNQPGP